MQFSTFEASDLFKTVVAPRYPTSSGVQQLTVWVHLRHSLHHCFSSPVYVSGCQHTVKTPGAILPPTATVMTQTGETTLPITGLTSKFNLHVRQVNRCTDAGNSRGWTANIKGVIEPLKPILRKGLMPSFLSNLHPWSLCYCSSTRVTVLGQVNKQLL